MFHHSKSGKISYGIVGVGRFGSALACELAAAGADIVVIDSDEDKVREMRELTDNAYIVANLEKKTLRKPAYRTATLPLSASVRKWTYPF